MCQRCFTANPSQSNKSFDFWISLSSQAELGKIFCIAQARGEEVGGDHESTHSYSPVKSQKAEGEVGIIFGALHSPLREGDSLSYAIPKRLKMNGSHDHSGLRPVRDSRVCGATQFSTRSVFMRVRRNTPNFLDIGNRHATNTICCCQTAFPTRQEQPSTITVI